MFDGVDERVALRGMVRMRGREEAARYGAEPGPLATRQVRGS